MKKAIGILLVCLLVLSVFFLGRSLGSGETAAEDGLSKRNLRLSATTDRNEPDKVIPLAQGNFPEAHYWSVKDVTVQLDGTRVPLEDALCEGLVNSGRCDRQCPGGRGQRPVQGILPVQKRSGGVPLPLSGV